MPTNDFDLEHFLPYRISLLANTISQGIASHYRDEHGITAAEWRVLAVLGRFPGSTASRLAQRTAMDKVAIHRAIKSLLARRLIERKTDRKDRRRRRLFITAPLGRAVFDDIVPRARRFEQELLSALSSAEARLLQGVLDKLQNAAEKSLADQAISLSSEAPRTGSPLQGDEA
ncbi:MAG: MarR family winged helix-turn-helix transcriptional regulator [Xanthomonadales bacterium]|jgi:DNA-binding MarR family transcriptional regulator|nr:MarR family winged helix-turn-helix transcriptional regulator [Xanthomonadales bacterium]